MTGAMACSCMPSIDSSAKGRLLLLSHPTRRGPTKVVLGPEEPRRTVRGLAPEACGPEASFIFVVPPPPPSTPPSPRRRQQA
jgi:hypothetical protein